MNCGTSVAAVNGRSNVFNMGGNRRQMANLEADTVNSRFFRTLHGTVKIILMDMASSLSLNGELGDARENICRVQRIISALSSPPQFLDYASIIQT